jgi:hypothetical protein
MREAPVEDHLRDTVKAVGGIAIKLNPLGYVGIPDRLVIGPGRLLAFIELKRPRGGRLSKKQARWHDRLREWGFEVETLNTKEAINEWIKRAATAG